MYEVVTKPTGAGEGVRGPRGRSYEKIRLRQPRHRDQTLDRKYVAVTQHL